MNTEIEINLGHLQFPLTLPDSAEVLRMGRVPPLPDPADAIKIALNTPLGTPSLHNIITDKLRDNPEAEAVIIISDQTRPVPYKGEEGILFPLVEVMMNSGLSLSRIKILVATGTHMPMGEAELKEFLDPRIFSMNISITNHDSRDAESLVCIGCTDVGGDIFLNRLYVEADIKILTGLVESHFMAGVSGGRKSICPGILAENSTYILHGGPILSSPRAADLVLENNPVHEEALRVARMAGCDLILNVTLDADYKITGVFAGDLDQAHLQAVEKLKTYAAIPLKKTYDIVLTHTGFVGVNHYQAAKGALVCTPALKPGGICILSAYHPDSDPIGRSNYRQMLRLLGELESEKFLEMILDPGWTFVPEQWEAQMWTRLFRLIPPENLIYNCFEIPENDFFWLPGTDGRTLAPDASTLKELTEATLAWAVRWFREKGREPEIAVLADGPYAIPVKS